LFHFFEGSLQNLDEVGDDDGAGGGGLAERKQAVGIGGFDVGDGEDDEADVVFVDEVGELLAGAEDLEPEDVGVLLARIVIDDADDAEEV